MSQDRDMQTPEEPQDVAQLVEAGNAALKAGDYNAAIEYYSQALAINPDDHEVLGDRADARNKLGDYPGAIDDLNAAIQLKPDEPGFWFIRGNARFISGDYPGAIDDLNAAIQLKPDGAIYWNNRASARFISGDYSGAIDDLNAAIQLKPDEQNYWFARGNLRYKLGDYPGAIDDYTAAIQLKQNDPDYWNNRGDARLKLGDYPEAIDDYTAAIQLKPDEPIYWFARVYARSKLGDYPGAIADSTAAIQRKQDDPNYWNNRGDARLKLGDYPGAIDDLTAAIQRKPDKPVYWNNRGDARLKLGDYPGAISDSTQAIKLKPDEPVYWYNRGRARFISGDYPGAIDDLTAAIQLKPDQPDYWNNRGDARLKLGDYPGAIADYTAAIQLKPDDPDYWQIRGLARIILGDYPGAIDDFTQAIQLKPDDPDYWKIRGNARNQLGDYLGAIADFTAAIQRKPDEPVFWLIRGLARVNLQHYEQAIADIDAALTRQRNFANAWKNRGLIARLSGWAIGSVATTLPLDMQNPQLDERGEVGEFACYKEGLKYCLPDQDPEGAAELYQAMGDAYLYWGDENFLALISYRQKASAAYEKALQILQPPARFFRRYLEILPKLYDAYIAQGDKMDKARLCLREGAELLQRLLADPQLPAAEKHRLREQVAKFHLVSVDNLVQQRDKVGALEVAEESKNACLTWLLSAWNQTIPRPTYGQMQQLVNPTTAMIYWHFSRATLTTFLIKDGAPEPEILADIVPNNPTSQSALEDWITQWDNIYKDYRRTGGENHPWRQQMPAQLQDLKRILQIDGIEQWLRQSTHINRLILSPHRDLHRLPLETLFDEQYTIVRLPSANMGLSLLDQQQTQLTQNNLLMWYHPDLLFSLLEADAIGSLFPTTVPPNEPGITSLQQALQQPYRYFHFTGHGTSDPSIPELSCLELNPQAKLLLKDIANLDLHGCEVSTLSACETGITGNQNITAEYVGLASALMQAKAANVVSTLWRTASGASAVLMVEFYRYLCQGIPPATALKQAKIWLRTRTYPDLATWYRELKAELPNNRDACRALDINATNAENKAAIIGGKHRPYAHEYYWAGFTMTGNP